MPITVAPLDEADIPKFVRIELEAFRSHPRIPALWPNGYTPDLYQFYEHEKLESFHHPNRRLIKAIDSDTGDTIAASEWTFALDTNAQAKKKPMDPLAEPPANWPAGGNWEMRRFVDYVTCYYTRREPLTDTLHTDSST